MWQARTERKPVLVTGATTQTSTVTANPDGSFRLTEHSFPVRVLEAGRWVPVNAALHRAGGWVYPVAATGYLRLSGGGTGPLITTTSGTHTLTETLAGIRLPVPVLSGATATYPGVLPGVDLKVTADTIGDCNDVFVVRDAAAARNPALRHLAFTVTTDAGLRMSTARDGALSFANGRGHIIFAGTAPVMWDSRVQTSGVRAAVSPATGRLTDLRNGQPLASSPAGPGDAARTAPITVTITGNRVNYMPDAALLANPHLAFPLYIDPPMNSALQLWGQVDTIDTNASHPKPSLMQVGYDGWGCTGAGCHTNFTARSFVRMSWPSLLRGNGVDIWSSSLYLQDAWAPSCDTSLGNFGVQVWRTGLYTSSSTWNNQPNWSYDEDGKSFAYGYNSSCKENTVLFNTLEAAHQAAAGSWPTITFGIRAASESDPYGWKQFTNDVTLTTLFDWPPYVSSPSTSPGTTCAGNDTIGLGDMMLYAEVTSPEGSQAGGLNPTITLYKGATATGASVGTYSGSGYASGAIYPVRVPQATLTNAAGGVPTEFTWTAAAEDPVGLTSNTITCHFTYDPTRPGAPSITNCPPASATTGQWITFNITPGSGTTPAGYHVQLNAAAPHDAKMATDNSGTATVSVKPTRSVNAVTVTAFTPGGNLGQSFTCVFNAAAGKTAPDGDMTGDSIPDLITPGGPGTGLPSGLWLAAGQTDSTQSGGDGQVVTSPVDIGIEGNALAGDYLPNDYDNSQVITGQFAGGGFQDVLAYYPKTGYGSILFANGDGSVLEAEDSSLTRKVPASTLQDANTNSPLQVVSAYNAIGGGNDNPPYPDLITLSGDSTDGYYLSYFSSRAGAASWDSPITLTQNTTPDGSMDWNNWQIATMQDPQGNVDMFLYNPAADALYLWTNLTVSQPNPTTDPTLWKASYSWYKLSSNWNPGAGATMRAADITGNGPALWTVTPTGQVTSWIATGIGSGSPGISSIATQQLLSEGHEWRLGNTMPNQGPYAKDTDAGGDTPLTLAAANSGVTWSGQDLFYPAAQFDGTTGYMTTSGQAINTTGDWSVSAWVKPGTLNGTVLSEYGTGASCMRITAYSPVPSAGYWRLATTNSNSTTATDSADATAGTSGVQPGIWTHLTATYNKVANWLELYVNGVPTAGASPSSTWSAGCNTFALSQQRAGGGTLGDYFNGKIADVQTWDTTLTPLQAATMSMTPGYVLFPSDGHHYPTGTTWTTTGAGMTFDSAGLHITPTGGTTVTFPTGGTAGASYMDMQADGNLVIYPASGPALWASNTAGNPADLMFFQPDGNLVIYDTTGRPLWASGTS